MQRISVHISDETKQRIDLIAKAENELESQLIRNAINAGLDVIYPKFNSAKALVDLAKMAQNLPFNSKEPVDISKDTAKYAFGQTYE